MLKLEMIHICIHSVGANVFIDMTWKTPASHREFPPSSVGGFTPLTSLVAAKKDKTPLIHHPFL